MDSDIALQALMEPNWINYLRSRRFVWAAVAVVAANRKSIHSGRVSTRITFDAQCSPSNHSNCVSCLLPSASRSHLTSSPLVAPKSLPSAARDDPTIQLFREELPSSGEEAVEPYSSASPCAKCSAADRKCPTRESLRVRRASGMREA